MRAAAPDLFGDPDLPAGFEYRPDVISASQEQALVRRFETLPFKPFEFHGHLGNRRIVPFGHRYDYTARSLRGADDMPDFLLPLREIAGRIADRPPAVFVQALVTEYAPGAGIGWHRDKPMFEDVAGLSLLAPCTLRLRCERDGKWVRRAVEIAPRSAYLLRGPVRELWEHSIVPMSTLRYSVTFRSFRA